MGGGKRCVLLLRTSEGRPGQERGEEAERMPPDDDDIG